MCENGIIESQRDQIYRIDEARKRVEERIGSNRVERTRLEEGASLDSNTACNWQLQQRIQSHELDVVSYRKHW